MKRFFKADLYLPIINGLIGDKLASRKDSWTIPMSFRLGGKDTSIKDLDKKLYGKTAVIFVHGLMADEKIWKQFSKLEKPYAALYLRYNTGLHISENGQLLATHLEELQDRFQFKAIHLIGHSMGGLVIRSACHYATQAQRRWVEKVAAVFLIAVPNAGAALEKLSHITVGILNRLARWHLKTVGGIINQRSNGIKDLRLAAMLDEDWNLALGKPSAVRASVPPLPGVHYHILIGSLAADEKSLLSKYFGDGLVTQQSAVGATLLKTSNIKVFVKTGHNSILNSREVFKYIEKALKQGGRP